MYAPSFNDDPCATSESDSPARDHTQGRTCVNASELCHMQYCVRERFCSHFAIRTLYLEAMHQVMQLFVRPWCQF